MKTPYAGLLKKELADGKAIMAMYIIILCCKAPC